MHIIVTALVVSNFFFAYLFFTNKKESAPAQPATQTQQQAGNSNSFDVANEYKKKFMSDAIKDNAKSFQNCYLTYLEGKSIVDEGKVDFLFKLDLQGSIESLEITDCEIKDDNFKNCVAKVFKAMRLAPPPLGINLNFTHTLSFRDEKKFLKEQAEKPKSPLELVPTHKDGTPKN